MSIVDRGAGRPLVLVPGLQGRWEWNTPTIDVLGRDFRVLTFSLGDVPESEPRVFDWWLDRIDALIDRTGERTAVVIGVSFGGLIAALYAARRPDRTAALVLVSAPAPDYAIQPQMLAHVDRPLLTFPVFALRAVRRLAPELIACRPTWPGRVGFAISYARWPLVAPGSPRRMAEWVRAWKALDMIDEISRVRAPTLVVTGEARLDGVVPVASTLRYLDLIPGSTHEVIHGTGHTNLVSKPQDFAAIVARFVARSGHR
jgi:pimeloyl-ACP methyl ester carboxylesterase